MHIHRLKIKNFRGIKFLDWTLPQEQKLVTLIGPGDSGKSTVLTALHFLLGDRWNIPFSDTDFFDVDITQEIAITAVLTDIPKVLLKESSLGLWLCGVHKNGRLVHDPTDDAKPALIVQLRVDADLEPTWWVKKTKDQSQRLTMGQRREFSTFSVDDRTDAQLRWSRSSALGRLSAKDGADRQVLAAAGRAAQEALSNSTNSSLEKLTADVQNHINRLGGGIFEEIKPGLDTSRSSLGAGLALYDGRLPLTSFGLGSRRLASLAIQQFAAGNRSIAIVDEIEAGLEPHRAVNLMRSLQTDENYSQVFVTTHAPIIVEQATIEALAVARNNSGEMTITSLAGAEDRMQAIRRSSPSSLLSRKILICEGKTEYGLVQACVTEWDKERIANSEPVAAGRAFALQDAHGGSEVSLRCIELKKLGYQVIGFLDKDTNEIEKHASSAIEAGIPLIRWDNGMQTEGQICSGLSWELLDEFVNLGKQMRSDKETVLADLQKVETRQPIVDLNTEDWKRQGIPIEEARHIVGRAANKSKWFKNIDGGELLGKWLIKHRQHPDLTSVWSRLRQIENFIYTDEDAE
ncbi:ATP-dependent nuclease [Corynebacterium glutamicum]|uniref:ATP-dependent nuclease n=1 Tax=Corynebacterium glutamicum TaxID=1718 RepID=UPI000771FFF3|nr:ATP-binding protein [Corynebacterium glutamicum]AMK79463.1 hypothetical protein APT58_15155 [Corynebacterium glutamicum]